VISPKTRKNMKKIALLNIFFIGVLTSFAQVTPPKKNIDKDVNLLLDSLSKVYHVRVTSIVEESSNDIKKTSISYYKNKKLIYKVIKTEESHKN
jgi:hypothetical protein